MSMEMPKASSQEGTKTLIEQLYNEELIEMAYRATAKVFPWEDTPSQQMTGSNE